MAELLDSVVTMNHGSGGRLSRELVDAVFGKHFANPALDARTDSAVLPLHAQRLAFTTDSYVVNPLFFPGGNIGTIAVCGTVNDLAVSGATPLYLSAAFIIEEGFALDRLEEIVATMADTARRAGVQIVTGDTKVVERGMADGLFITTSGVGTLCREFAHVGTAERVRPGDAVIVSGAVGDHGMAILAQRNGINLSAPITSDCAPLNALIAAALRVSPRIGFMRDATRGGLATVLCELAEGRPFGVEISEAAVPVHAGVRGLSDMFGFDPLYVANEGKVVMVVPAADADAVLSEIRSHAAGSEAAIVGAVVDKHPGRVSLRTEIGGARLLEMLAGDQLPRIC